MFFAVAVTSVAVAAAAYRSCGPSRERLPPPPKARPTPVFDTLYVRHGMVCLDRALLDHRYDNSNSYPAQLCTPKRRPMSALLVPENRGVLRGLIHTDAKNDRGIRKYSYIPCGVPEADKEAWSMLRLCANNRCLTWSSVLGPETETGTRLTRRVNDGGNIAISLQWNSQLARR